MGFSELSHDMFIFTPDFWTKGLFSMWHLDVWSPGTRTQAQAAQCSADSTWRCLLWLCPVLGTELGCSGQQGQWQLFTPGIVRGLLLGMAGWQHGLEEGDAELLSSSRVARQGFCRLS